MEKETLKYIVDEMRNMTRDLTVYEIRPELDAMRSAKNEAINELSKATVLAEKLSAQVAVLSVRVIGESSDKRHIDSQRVEIERLEGQVEAISSDLDATRDELSMINDGYKQLKLMIGLIVQKAEKDGIADFKDVKPIIDSLRNGIAG